MTKPTDSPEVFKALMAAAADAIIIADAHGTILDANSAAHAMFGYRDRGLCGRSVNDLMPPDIARNHDSFMARYLETGESRILGVGRELEGQKRDGTQFPLHLSLGQARIESETLFVAILHDLTTRRKAEQALERSQRMEALGQLTGGVAHDFNNLLTIINGNLELLEGKLTDTATSEIIADAHDAAQVGTALTGQLLSFARRGILMPEIVDANHVISDMTKLLRTTMGQEITLSTSLEPDLWVMLVDPTQVRTAILNLAMNARGAMPEGGTLTIKTANIHVDDAYIAQEIDVARGDYVRITVSDTGHGMTDNTRKRAFEPFFTTKPGSQGTGLGLSLVYGFVRQSGGHVTLYSEVGQGSTFSLYFPKADQREDLPNTQVDAPSIQTSLTGEHVLIVEDNPSIRDLTSKRLDALGCTTLTASSADEALELMARHPGITVLLSDVIMPGSMTGYELAKLVRARDPQIAVLLTTAYSGELLDQSGELQSGFEVLRKPYRQEDLIRALLRVMAPLKPHLKRS